jgi:hypothetical protein
MTFPPYNPMTMIRTRPAYLAILDELLDDQWHPVEELQQAAQQASDLTPRSIDNLIRWGYRHGPGPRPWRKRGKGEDRLLQRAPTL